MQVAPAQGAVLSLKSMAKPGLGTLLSLLGLCAKAIPCLAWQCGRKGFQLCSWLRDVHMGKLLQKTRLGGGADCSFQGAPRAQACLLRWV